MVINRVKKTVIQYISKWSQQFKLSRRLKIKQSQLMVKPKYRLRLKNIADFKWIRLIYCFIGIKGLIDPTITKNN